ncbi:MAG: hypothetical protein US89_C0002G0072 [Candidatus Peregrinibacteria bacterium GW2011_GWF2_38_29]|nr:MAG: hypothetical protein US89_C0002G0072 [Candidatus Peregrinibacteria bacterium GW2011_GWF2_38_29]
MTSGIILGYSVQKEYDRFVSIFTRAYGKIRATAKFAQKPSSPFVGRLDKTNICKLNLYKSTKGSFTIRQCILEKTFQKARNNILRFALIEGITEIADKLTYQNYGMRKYFTLIEEAMSAIEVLEKPYLIYLIFKIKFLDMAGIVPSFKHCMMCNKKIEIGDIIAWNIENLICNSCLQNKQGKLQGVSFEPNMLKLINFALKNSYEKILQIKISKEDIEFLETIISEIWHSHNLPQINSEKVALNLKF